MNLLHSCTPLMPSQERWPQSSLPVEGLRAVVAGPHSHTSSVQKSGHVCGVQPTHIEGCQCCPATSRTRLRPVYCHLVQAAESVIQVAADVFLIGMHLVG
jgi:hypothetical protein